ncbi:MAG: sugar phosphate isomerase/epimerase [Bacteroidales bacterium]|nr:sugar phosphate isomerase/epimerase [Bacteroidales bacterium]
MQTRRKFFKRAVLAAAAVSAGPAAFSRIRENSGVTPDPHGEGMWFKISLAQWSLNKSLKGGKLDNLDFPAYAKKYFDIHAVEYVNQFFTSAEPDYIKELLKRTKDIDVKNLLIMIDNEGSLGDTDEADRKKAVENHYKWVESAHILGCHSIRVNAAGNASRKEVASSAEKSLTELSQFAADYRINVIVENHGGYSSDANWLSSVISNVGMVNCGTLPDFGNFWVTRSEEYDKYKGTKQLMAFARGVSAKSHDFDEDGNETAKDYYKLLKIVKDAGYRGHIGIEYEGSKLSENEGIMATKKLLTKAGMTV